MHAGSIRLATVINVTVIKLPFESWMSLVTVYTHSYNAFSSSENGSNVVWVIVVKRANARLVVEVAFLFSL